MIIEQNKEIEFQPQKNKIICNQPPVLKNTNINFKGTNNILYLEDDIRIYDSNISFCGNNAIVYLSKNVKHPYKIKLDAWGGTTTYFGHDSYFNGVFSAIVSERQNFFVGNEGVFSFGIWCRTADPHIIYDIETKKRINLSKSILIGDHVWIGQNSLVLKGTSIGSGSIIAANSVVSGKTIESNSIWGGNPANRIRSQIFFSDKSVHNYSKKQTKASMMLDDDSYVYALSEQESETNRKSMNGLFKQLSGTADSEERLEMLKEYILNNNSKTRFAFVPSSAGSNHSMKKALLSMLKG